MVELAMAHARARAHVLHAARAHDPVMAHRIAVFEFAAQYVGDDLHVAMRMRPKAFARLHGIVVEDPQRSPMQVVRIKVIGEAEAVMRLEPAEVEHRAFRRTLDREGWGCRCRCHASYDPARAAEDSVSIVGLTLAWRKTALNPVQALTQVGYLRLNLLKHRPINNHLLGNFLVAVHRPHR